MYFLLTKFLNTGFSIAKSNAAHCSSGVPNFPNAATIFLDTDMISVG